MRESERESERDQLLVTPHLIATHAKAREDLEIRENKCKLS